MKSRTFVCPLFHLLSILLIAAMPAALFAEESPKPDPRFGEWIDLFNGKNFDGWFVSKPPNVPMNWKVEDGAMTNLADPAKRKHNIATERKFHNYEAHIEFKIQGENEGNAGLYNRGRAEIQIYNSYGKPIDDRSLGALYKYKAPLVNAAKPAGEWNTVDWRFNGTFMDVVINGQLVQNNTYVPQKTGAGRTDEFDSPGMFELQGDHDKVWFRNVRIRPMFETPGWKKVFNGKDLTGWKALDGSEPKWTVEDGALTNAAGHMPDLITTEKFGDCLVYYEYKSEGNSGFYLRNLWEIQIENTHGKQATKNTDGALYDFYPPLVNASKPRGEWSKIEAKVIGRKITVFQNGQLIHNERECPARTYNTKDSSGLDEPGPMLLQGDHGRVWFTNIWILPLN